MAISKDSPQGKVEQVKSKFEMLYKLLSNSTVSLYLLVEMLCMLKNCVGHLLYAAVPIARLMAFR